MTMLSRFERLLTLIPEIVDFARRVIHGFRRNQCFLLAGAIAYYALLSVVPMLILSMILLSHVLDPAAVLSTMSRYLDWLVPGQSRALLGDVARFIDSDASLGLVLFATMMFFSTLCISVTQKAMAVIFPHRKRVSRGHYVQALVIPYCFVLVLGMGLVALTVMATALQAMEQDSIVFYGHVWSLRGVSGLLLYLLGIACEVVLIAAIYWLIPIGLGRVRHALAGGVVVTLLWEIVRHMFVWYFASISKVSVVYGSLTTTVLVLFSLEIAAILLLIGAQVISEYEQRDVIR